MCDRICHKMTDSATDFASPQSRSTRFFSLEIADFVFRVQYSEHDSEYNNVCRNSYSVMKSRHSRKEL